MTDKLDRFTKKARHVLTLAQEEAQRLHHGYIGTEHLLLGLIGEKNGMASKVLKGLGGQAQRAYSRQLRELVDPAGRPHLARLTSLPVPNG